MHPTVKPLALMRYLCRLACPPGGLILDLLMGSGSTLIAAQDLGFRAIGIETEKQYCRIAANRLSARSAKSAAKVLEAK
jgi:site-specific DNA-methyltransferase (adenine-specific)